MFPRLLLRRLGAVDFWLERPPPFTMSLVVEYNGREGRRIDDGVKWANEKAKIRKRRENN